MKWLTIPDIKKQLRIDFDDEDDELELYGSSAEDTVLNYLNRTYQPHLSRLVGELRRGACTHPSSHADVGG